jgi:hypothetical protein
MCTRPRRAHVSVGPSPSDDDSFRSGDERKRSPEVGGLADLPSSVSLVEVDADFRFPGRAAWRRTGREQARLLARHAEPANGRPVAIARPAKQRSDVDPSLE